MSKFVFAYFGEPSFTSREEGASYQSKWKAWARDLGDVWVDPGMPIMKQKIVSASGVSDFDGANRLTGFSVVKADSLEAAIEMAQGCPHLEFGTIEVAQGMDMGMNG